MSNPNLREHIDMASIPEGQRAEVGRRLEQMEESRRRKAAEDDRMKDAAKERVERGLVDGLDRADRAEFERQLQRGGY
jgi:molecular chaperone GrpE (heat shock protein)